MFFDRWYYVVRVLAMGTLAYVWLVVTEGEIRQAIRSSGAGPVEAVGAVILETDGTLSAITLDEMGSGSALVDVDGQT